MGSARRCRRPPRAVVVHLTSSMPRPRSPSATDERAPEMTRHGAERVAMARALEIAQSPGVPLGPNPRVGCVLLGPDGSTIAEGFHRGAGTPHAEVAALTEAGDRANGATAVITLEPCNHTGRTGPCARALVDAGGTRVVFAQPDTTPVAAGGAGGLPPPRVRVRGR